jgi:diaminopimelate epimerase
METNFFVKSHGLGNEYIVFDQATIDFELTVERTIQLCNIHVGIGSDGILLKVPTVKADFGLRILNPDGSEAEKSGRRLTALEQRSPARSVQCLEWRNPSSTN